MSLRFFRAQSVPAEIADTLRRHGHQVALLREILPIRWLDRHCLKKCGLQPDVGAPRQHWVANANSTQRGCNID